MEPELNIEQAIREYLPNVLHMSLATVADGAPWICEVHFSFDDELNIYFRSRTTTRHAQEIAVNPRVAGNIVEQHGMTDKPRCVSFEGTAELLEDVTQDSVAYKVVSERHNLDAEILDSEKFPPFYKITVTDFYMFDGRQSKPAQKYHLPWNN
jgi:uncharacterized protein YhbP (UPF0306 family)